MKNSLALVLIAACLVTGASAFAKDCKTGKPCGNACIAKDKTCASDAPAAKKCKTGKACGNACISKDAVCTK